MPNRLSPWSAKVVELLADGEWHNRDRIIAQAGPFVPAERAMRERERNAERQRRKRNGKKSLKPGPKPNRSEEYQIGVGRRELVMASFASIARIETRIDPDGTRYVRYVREDSGNQNPSLPPGT